MALMRIIRLTAVFVCLFFFPNKRTSWYWYKFTPSLSRIRESDWLYYRLHDCIHDPPSNLNQHTWREWHATFEPDET